MTEHSAFFFSQSEWCNGSIDSATLRCTCVMLRLFSCQINGTTFNWIDKTLAMVESLAVWWCFILLFQIISAKVNFPVIIIYFHRTCPHKYTGLANTYIQMTTNIFINFLCIIGQYFSLYEIKLKQRAELDLFQVTKSLIIDQNYSNCLVFMTNVLMTTCLRF